MGFASGSVSFRRFAVLGKHPKAIDQKHVDALAEFALKVGDVGVPEEVEYGWSGGRHILDGNFSFEHNVFGDALAFALRVDTNKVPGDLKKAYQIMEEDAVAKKNPSGFLSKQQKRDVKDTVKKQIDEDLRSGKFRRSKLTNCLWDFPSHTLYAPAAAATQEKLQEIFERTFGLELVPLTSGSLALHVMEPAGKKRDYEDLRPTRFVQGPDGEGQVPEYPWVAKGPQPKDFLGNEFMLWLWHQAENSNGEIQLIGAGGEKIDPVTVYFDKALDLDCAYGQTGKDTLRGEGAVRMPEALDALRTGKLPRKASLLMHHLGNQYALTFNPESFAVGSLALPEIEDAENARALFEERIDMLRDFCQTTDGLFRTFLHLRASSGWESQVGRMRKWIMTSGRPTPAMAVA
ncbi:MAG TPA: hypothetical protein VFE58_05215 [Tepidisphaeraceae bacterium]|jgi:hypothetical protein|nr:hypothetical protein [Tepidisphaeraceae bacterium]